MQTDLLAALLESSEGNLVHLLDEWSSKWKHKGRIRAVGPGAYEKYCTLGLYAHGGVSGILRASDDEDAEQISGQNVDFHRDPLQPENGTSSRSPELERPSQSCNHTGFIYWRSSLGGK